MSAGATSVQYSTVFKLAACEINSEAEVETRLLAKIFKDLGYPDKAIIPKKSLRALSVNEGSKRSKVSVDFFLKASNGYARVVVEAKNPAINVQSAWGQAASYALSYNADKSEDQKVQWLLISIGASTCKELIRRFERINLSSIDEDLNGRMFEVFLNAAVRGRGLGQYFTPRSVVDFMTRIALQREDFTVKNPPVTIDACSGTCGFLIEVMAYLLSGLRDDARFNEDEKDLIKDKICNKCLFGIEANERVARIARINMYLHGDGGSHIFHGDGLDNSPEVHEDMNGEEKTQAQEHKEKILPGTFDLVLSNPPFSMTYKKDNEAEERILKQRDLSENMSSAKSNILFLGRYLELLKPAGEMLIVIDDTILNGSTCLSIRQWLLENFLVVGIHSLPFNTFFKANAGVKTSVLHARKKKNRQEKQGYIYMSVSNNIGHDNSLKDTPERNNLQDIFLNYVEWRRTGEFEPLYKENQNRRENLECPQQTWLLSPRELTAERLDAFYYSPELKKTRTQLENSQSAGVLTLKKGGDLKLRAKLKKTQKIELAKSGEVFKYIEIGDVTDYGLIMRSISGTFDELPSRGEYRVSKGDILVAINISSRGTVAIVPEEYDGAICTSGFFVIAPENYEQGLLLWYCLRSEHCRKQIYYLSQTACQPELKMQTWKDEFLIPIPTHARDAINESKAFQKSLRSLLNAGKFRFQ